MRSQKRQTFIPLYFLCNMVHEEPKSFLYSNVLAPQHGMNFDGIAFQVDYAATVDEARELIIRAWLTLRMGGKMWICYPLFRLPSWSGEVWTDLGGPMPLRWPVECKIETDDGPTKTRCWVHMRGHLAE